MNIIERDITAYAFECLTGISGDADSKEAVYYVLANTKHSPKNVVLRTVLEMFQAGNPYSAYLKEQVYQYLLDVIADNNSDLRAALDFFEDFSEDADELHELLESAVELEKEDSEYIVYVMNHKGGFLAYIYYVGDGGMKLIAKAYSNKQDALEKELSKRFSFKLRRLDIEAKG